VPRLLHYVAGIRLVIDPYDHRLWRFAMHGKRYTLRDRGGSAVLQTEDGAPLGTFHDWSRAIATAREHAHTATTEQIPIIAAKLGARQLS
jgi:hypothetical protein